ncbi:hypothetical protein AURDEDRAFT_151544 [Auricularia subglabra TFB-10046 SS5]|nr:hypothetical protein AURDEDRAFT_151544 [Auricularia subglabra TFB-10046 SS5]
MFFATVVILSTILAPWARLVNVTIDDQFGDAQTGTLVSYRDQEWREDSEEVLYHAEYPPGLDWGKIQNGTLSRPTNISWFFESDGSAEFFQYNPSTSEEGGRYMYREPILWRENLGPGRHQATVMTFPNDRAANVFALFDYALYSTEIDDSLPGNNSSTTSTPPTSTPSISSLSSKLPLHQLITIVAVSITCGIVVIAGALWYFWRRWKIRHDSAQVAMSSSSTTPWLDDPGSGQPEPYPIDIPRSSKPILRLLGEKPRAPAAKLGSEKARGRAPDGARERPSLALTLDDTPREGRGVETSGEEIRILRETTVPLLDAGQGGAPGKETV